jgi:hypothetical protein
MEKSALTSIEEETASILRASDVGALATVESFACTIKKEDGGTPGLARTLSGNCSGSVALRREQLGSNHCENQAMVKEGEADLRCHKHSPRKRRNGGTPVGYLG